MQSGKEVKIPGAYGRCWSKRVKIDLSLKLSQYLENLKMFWTKSGVLSMLWCVCLVVTCFQIIWLLYF